MNSKFYRRYGKRLFDIIFSLAAIIILFPILVIVALLVRFKLGSPILFRQNRPGKDGNAFKMYKFRTMTDELNSKGELLPDSIRLTGFGKTLRTTSLDELPELWNILRGDMSVVGPRPLLVEYLPLYNTRQMRRHEVSPGLTGYAQVNGRNMLEWNERFELDVNYVENMTFLLDCIIILRTIQKVFLREGISSETTVTMEPFRGDFRK